MFVFSPESSVHSPDWPGAAINGSATIGGPPRTIDSSAATTAQQQPQRNAGGINYEVVDLRGHLQSAQHYPHPHHRHYPHLRQVFPPVNAGDLSNRTTSTSSTSKMVEQHQRRQYHNADDDHNHIYHKLEVRLKSLFYLKH